MALIDEVKLKYDLGMISSYIMLKHRRTSIGSVRMTRQMDGKFYLSCFSIFKPEYRGHKLGSYLLEQAKVFTKGRPIELQAACIAMDETVLPQELLVQFYERHGFVLVDPNNRERRCTMIWDGISHLT